MSQFFDFDSVTFLTTDKCTARCAHCCVSSSPRRKAKLTFDQIKSSIDKLIERHKPKVIVFAGGEPSLLKNDLVRAIQYCTDNGIHSRVVTNGSWAIDEKRTTKMLDAWQGAGLRDLNISADDYHLPWIKLDNVRRIWDESKGRGFNAVVIALALQRDSEVTIQRVRDELNDQTVPTCWEDDGSRKEEQPPRAADGTCYMISNRNSSRSGRGVVELDHDQILFTEGKGEYSACRWIQSSPAISPKNELISCCGFEVRKIGTMNYGNLDENELTSIEECGDDVILHGLSKVGPKRLLEFAVSEGGEASYDRHVSMCEACEDLMTKPENIKILRRNAAKVAAMTVAASHTTNPATDDDVERADA